MPFYILNGGFHPYVIEPLPPSERTLRRFRFLGYTSMEDMLNFLGAPVKVVQGIHVFHVDEGRTPILIWYNGPLGTTPT